MIEEQEVTSNETTEHLVEPGPQLAPMAPPKSIIREYFEQGVVTVIMAFFLMTFIAQAVQVPTGSMQNNIHIGDHLFVNKFIFGPPTHLLNWLLPQREIRRGDIIVFKFPNDPKVNYVKRVIGLPGDEVRIEGRHVYINGKQLPEQHVIVELQDSDHSFNPEIRVEPAPPGAKYRVYYKERHGEAELDYETQSAKYAVHGPVIVPPESYFALGDNRDNSLDGRYWGFVPRDNIIGRALYVYWSFNPRDPERPGSGIPLLDFFTRTNWRRTGAAIK